MRLLRFIFPFLFVRNWHDGAWELSLVRVVLCTGLFLLVVFGLLIAFILQTPVVYTGASL
jgi:hypothetical protein